MSLLVWLAFGAVAVAPAVQHLTWQILVYAVASLTLIRTVLIAAALAGTGPGWPTALFAGRNGPRGLASVVFALLALEELCAKDAQPVPSRLSRYNTLHAIWLRRKMHRVTRDAAIPARPEP